MECNVGFCGTGKQNFLHAQGAFARFSAPKYFGRASEEQLSLPAKRASERVLNKRFAYFGAPRIIFSNPDRRFAGNISQEFLED